MPALQDLLSADHDRLDALLAAALRDDGSVDYASYAEFRAGLLRHIAIEEKVLFPEMKRLEGESEVLRQLHRDHAALSVLLVPPPTRAEIEAIREILEEHNPLEEDAGGFYDVLEQLEGDALDDLMTRVHAVPPVVLAQHADTNFTRSAIEQLLRQAAEGRRKLHQK